MLTRPSVFSSSSTTAAPTSPTGPPAGQTTAPPPASTAPPSSPSNPPPSSAPPPPSSEPPPSPTPDPPSQPPSSSPTPDPATSSPPPPPPPPPPASTTDAPPPASSPPPDSTTAPPPPPTSTPVTVITVTPSSVPDDTTVTVTTTSLNTNQPSSTPGLSSTSRSSSSSTSSNLSPTALPVTGGGGLSQPAKIAIAIIIPIFAVVVIAFLGIFFWRRYKNRKDSEEMRRKEVEEYGYNPNNDASGSGGAVLGAGTIGSHGGEMAESDGTGYRGWGSTAGGRKPSGPLSASAGTSTANPGYNKASYMEGGMASMQPQYTPPSQPELYGSPVGSAAVPAVAGAGAIGVAESEDPKIQSPDRHSKSPVLSSPTQRPSTADSSTIGAAAITGPSELDDGLHRGDSVASSRYTNATRRSDGSEHHVITTGNGYMTNYQSVDGNDYYNDVANPYAPEHDYGNPAAPPMIQQVGARRNTRIENPADSHYAQMPRQGNSGIAQNF
ncbi:hypothetical protein Dda_0459 [Drechslerella dactyloides]|uniref:Uncharacterized protein n=1 Tax=Drechslerella dactyloides TaxID=74499 RepID=A0AAD6J4M4_DREDA|nr:hypothetical protein Dda_0459 [Drechslerella dactyloides]